MNIRLYVNQYHDSVFKAMIGSGIPEPVFVTILSMLPVNESIMVEVEEDGREYEISKVYQQDLGDQDVAYFFETPVKTESDFEYTYTYLLWMANGLALGLFRIITADENVVGLERAKEWGKHWSPWTYKNDGQWKGVTGDDRINDFVVRRLMNAVENYIKEITNE